jgi:hypothetical protein
VKLETVSELVRLGADHRAVDKASSLRTHIRALFAASPASDLLSPPRTEQDGLELLHAAVLGNCVSAFKYVLALGHTVSGLQPLPSGESLLHLAVLMKHVEMVGRWVNGHCQTAFNILLIK